MRNHRTLADLITGALGRGGLTGYELARHLEDRHDLTMRGREGSLYAALIELERKGYVESSWVALEAGGRRRRYRLPVLVSVAPNPEPAPAPEPGLGPHEPSAIAVADAPAEEEE